MALAAVTLDDKYLLEEGRVHITGSQALVRLAMMQFLRDKAAGLNTACFISGYRGSPMHNIDKELWRVGGLLEDRHIHFQPGINEDLAATACWGCQQSSMFGDARYDGVFAMWYGKGPGLDRSLDAIRHANLAGTSKHGGVLAVVGDDHAMKSTDVPATSEPTFQDLMMPVLYPATVQEVVDFGLIGWAMSRFSGCWTGYKVTADTVDTAASIGADIGRPELVMPNDVEFPSDGVHMRIGDFWYHQEERLRRYKIPAALAFGRANGVNRVAIESPRPRFGLIASGKAYIDTRQALHELGIDSRMAAELGITLLKIGMPHPLDLDMVRDFADGLEEVFVVEEKRRFIETQVKDALYALPDSRRPRVVGHYDEHGRQLIASIGETDPEQVTRAIARRVEPFHTSDRITARLAFIEAKAKAAAEREALKVTRLPYFCSGCPHNTSTKVPEGSRAHGGVGCHFMASYMDRNTWAHTHMGGEGANWIGQAPFVESNHVFQNLGDGTYYHSGLLAIRAAIAANVNITYKILFNDAVAMTGGQPVDGPLTPDMIARQVYEEGIRKIVVVSDEPDKYPVGVSFAPGTTIEHRRALDRVQRECRDWPGVSVIIYDQTCAAEKRRRRKRGLMVDPPKRIFINHRVCEGCGDCNAKSNCLSVLPLDTEFGRKRQIDQSSCNKDYSCVEGFCPSFVGVIGGKPRRIAARAEAPAHLTDLPEPAVPAIADGETYGVLVTGIGGTGVVTIGALLTMAAHMEGKAFSTVDQFGMAQKGGAVTSHIRIANSADDIHAARLNTGGADLLLGCDSLVTGDALALDTMAAGKTRAVINTYQAITGHFTRDPDLQFPGAEVTHRIRQVLDDQNVDFLDATRIATGLLGDSIATNLFVLGYAYQKGLVPVTADGIARAIELNAVAVSMNQQAFDWGRRAAVDLDTVTEIALKPTRAPDISTSLEALIDRRVQDLTAYQDTAYAERYRNLVGRVQSAEADRAPGMTGLAEAVARYAYKLMAYKDEYEVARLYTDGRFVSELKERFEGDYKLQFNLAPPLFAPRDQETGLLTKRAYGPWILPAMRLLAGFKRLRGSAFDPFGYTAERKQERQLIADYEATVAELIAGLTHDNHALAVQIASIPERIRGYGHVKERHLTEAKAHEADLLAAWRRPDAMPSAAE